MKTLSLNSRWFPPLRALALLALGSLCPVTGFAQSTNIELSLVAMTGQPAPGTNGTFSTSGFILPVISGRRQTKPSDGRREQLDDRFGLWEGLLTRWSRAEKLALSHHATGGKRL